MNIVKKLVEIKASVIVEIDSWENEDVSKRIVDIYLHDSGENGHMNKRDVGSDSSSVIERKMVSTIEMISIPENEIDSDKFYAIQGTHIKKLFDLKKRLYSEKRMNADEMRDRAHLIGLLLDDLTEVPEL